MPDLHRSRQALQSERVSSVSVGKIISESLFFGRCVKSHSAPVFTVLIPDTLPAQQRQEVLRDICVMEL